MSDPVVALCKGLDGMCNAYGHAETIRTDRLARALLVAWGERDRLSMQATLDILDIVEGRDG